MWNILIICLFSLFFIGFNLKPLLYLYPVGIECCGLRAFEDSRCYLELVNHQYIVRVLPEGTHISHLCFLAAGAPHNQHSVHRHGKVHIKKTFIMMNLECVVGPFCNYMVSLFSVTVYLLLIIKMLFFWKYSWLVHMPST